MRFSTSRRRSRRYADQRRKRSPGPQGLLAKAALVGLGAVLEQSV